LDNLVQEYSIDAIQAEDIQMQRGVTTYKKLVALLFFLQMYSYKKKIDFLAPVHVNTWRLKTVRRLFDLPKGDKATWYHYIFSQVAQESLTTDHSDAIGIAIHLADMLGRSIPSLNGLIRKDICI
jgi:hypothetical protein